MGSEFRDNGPGIHHERCRLAGVPGKARDETSRNGEHIIGHGGDTRLFHSNLALFPEHDLGVFTSFHSLGGGTARGRFFDAFVDHYFPVEISVPVPLEDFGERDDRFTGRYAMTRHPYSTFAKLIDARNPAARQRPRAISAGSA